MPDNSATAQQPLEGGVLDVHPHHALALEKPMDMSAPIEQIPSTPKSKSPAAQLAPHLPQLPHDKPLSDLVAPFNVREPERPAVEYVPVRVTVPPMPRPQVFSTRPQIAPQPPVPPVRPVAVQSVVPTPAPKPAMAPPVVAGTPIRVMVVPPAPALATPPAPATVSSPPSTVQPVDVTVAPPEPAVQPVVASVVAPTPPEPPQIPAPKKVDEPPITTDVVPRRGYLKDPVKEPDEIEPPVLPSSVMVPAPGQQPASEEIDAPTLKPFTADEDAATAIEAAPPSRDEAIPPPAFLKRTEEQSTDGEIVPVSAFAGITQPERIFSHNTRAVWSARRFSRIGYLTGTILLVILGIVLVGYLLAGNSVSQLTHLFGI